ncbi:hypothetical protein KJ855_04665 [Patescibacteria group bacterium]|nr:hypothetical protein [Patescibacteria group bacterium]
MSKKAQSIQDTWWRKMSETFFLMLVFCMPLNVSLQWFTEWSMVEGRVIDFMTYYLYGTEILLVLVLLCWLVDLLVKFWRHRDWEEWDLNVWQGLVVLFFGLLAFWGIYSSIWAINGDIALYRGIKLVEVFLLFGYIVLGIGKNWKLLAKVGMFFVSGVVIQSIWGIMQYWRQSDFGLWWLGESILGRNELGVAKIVVEGEKVVRAYGGLPHANVYSFFLFAGLVVLLASVIYSNQLRIIRYSWVWGVLLGLVSVGCLVGYSRSVWVAGIIIVVGFLVEYFFYKKNYELQITNYEFWVPLVMILGVGVWWNWDSVFARTSLDLAGDVSFNVRVWLDQAADWMIDLVYYGGVGLGNFVPTLPYFGGEDISWWMYQPVHNVYKLVFAELGVGGFIFLVLMMVGLVCTVVFSRVENYPKVFWSSVVIALIWLQFFDHYMWDVWQGQLVFVFLLGMMLVCSGIVIKKC